jgi:PEP-CTERM motif
MLQPIKTIDENHVHGPANIMRPGTGFICLEECLSTCFSSLEPQKPNLNQKREQPMKRHKKWIAGALAAAGGLMMTGTTQAQYATTVISDFNSISATAVYANWQFGTVTSSAAGWEINAQGYGSAAFAPDAGVVDAPGATEVQLTFTINNVTTPSTDYMGPNFDLTDNGTHLVFYGAYNHYPNAPGTFTVTAALNGTDPTDITAFNLEMDPAGYGSGNAYDVTYTSLVLLTPTPEPTTLVLGGLGAAGLLAFRRRQK